MQTFFFFFFFFFQYINGQSHALGAQWLSGRVLDARPKGPGFEPHRRHSVVSLSKNINPSLVLVQPRKTCPFITERLLMGRKESNQTNNPMQPGNIHTTYATNNISNEFVYMCILICMPIPLILLFICINIQYNQRVS